MALSKYSPHQSSACLYGDGSAGTQSLRSGEKLAVPGELCDDPPPPPPPEI